MQKTKTIIQGAILLVLLTLGTSTFAGDADIILPDLKGVTFLGGSLSGPLLLYLGLAACVVGVLFGIYEFFR